MTIKIKTSLITLEITDEPKDADNMSVRHSVPELPTSLKAAIDEAIRLHNEVKK